MTDADRFRLLFGPYQAPALRKGGSAFCLFRDCDVVITGWTNALIPWPRCRALDTGGGGSGILVDEELARAIRHESATAIKHWWGASRNVVWKWRQALEVGRADAEGSRRLIQAAAQAGANVVKQLEFSDEEREARRQRAVALNQIRNTRAHYPLLWTPEEIALLGTLPDPQVAAMIGRSWNAVRLKREKLGIAQPHDGRKRR